MAARPQGRLGAVAHIELADSCAESFQRYAELQTDNETVQAFGEQLAQAGLGHSSLLALIKGLQDFVWGQGELIGEARAASCYCLPLLAGYMAARETYLLAEQERTRLALERAQQHAGR